MVLILSISRVNMYLGSFWDEIDQTNGSFIHAH